MNESSTDSSNSNAAESSGSNRRDLLAIFLIVVVDVLGLTIVIPLLPFYAQSFGATPMDVGFLISLFAICQFVSGPILGGLSDQYGRRPLLILSQIGTLIGFLVLAWAQAYWMILLSRIIDGVTAGNLSIAQAYISDVTEPKDRAKSFALIGIAFGLGFLIGPAFGGLLATHGYQTPIFASAILSLISILASVFFLREPLRRRSLTDTSERRLSVFDLKVYAPFFKNETLSKTLLQFFFFSFSFALFTSGFALFAERRLTWDGHSYGPKEVGLIFAYSGFLGIFIQGGLVARLVKKFGENKVSQMGFVGASLGYLVLAFTFGLPALLLSATISAFGNGVLRPALTSLISHQADQRQQGLVMGLSQSLNSLAQIVAPLMTGLLIRYEWLSSWSLTAGLFTLAGLLLSQKTTLQQVTKSSATRTLGLIVSFALISALDVRADETTKGESKIRVRALGEVSNLDWNHAVAHFDGSIIRNMMDGLLLVGPSNELTAGLALSWTSTQNGKRYTFTLRKDATWTDGTPLDASHFVESWRRLLQPSQSAHYAYLLFDVVGAEEFHSGRIKSFGDVGVKAIDSHTLEVSLKDSRPSWLWNLTMWPTFPIRPDLIARFGEGSWARPGAIQTIGPFTLHSHAQGARLTLKKNPNYYRKSRGNIETIELHFFADDQEAIQAYDAGKLDWIPIITAFDPKKMGTHPDLHVSPFPRTFHLDFNFKKYPTSSKVLRDSVIRSINRGEFLPFVKKGYRPAYSLAPPGFMGHSSTNEQPFDPELAKKNLKKAGLLTQAKPLTLELATLALDDYRQVAEFVASQLQQNLDTVVNLHFFETKDLGTYLLNNSPFHLWILAASAKTPDPDYFFSLFLSTSGNNQTGWANPSFDQTILQARTDTHPIERSKRYAEAGRILTSGDLVTMPLYFESRHALIRPEISGWTPNPFHFFSFRDIQWIGSSRLQK